MLLKQYGLNAFYDSVELRKGILPHPQGGDALPLQGQRAWFNGQRSAQSATCAELHV